MKLLKVLAISILLCSFGTVAFAYPVFQNTTSDEYNVLYFQNVETWLDNDDNNAVSAGDQFFGIFSVQNIMFGTENLNSGLWDADNVSPGIDSFTGYFATTVDYVDLTGAVPQIVQKAGDYNGILSGNEIIAFYTDDATGYNTTGTVQQGISRATDGDLWATFGLVESDDYYYLDGSINPPGVGNQVGTGYGGLSIIVNNSGIDFTGIDDPIEGKIDSMVDLYLRSYIGQITNFDFQGGSAIANGESWTFVSNDPAGFNGNTIPEPNTILLFGLGLLGAARIYRKK